MWPLFIIYLTAIYAFRSPFCILFVNLNSYLKFPFWGFPESEKKNETIRNIKVLLLCWFKKRWHSNWCSDIDSCGFTACRKQIWNNSIEYVKYECTDSVLHALASIILIKLNDKIFFLYSSDRFVCMVLLALWHLQSTYEDWVLLKRIFHFAWIFWIYFFIKIKISIFTKI